MPSPADRSRRRLEWSLRGVALAALAGLLFGARPRGLTGPESVNISAHALAARLPDWARVVAPSRVHVAFDTLPDVVSRDWMTALAATGSEVRWSTTALPSAASVEPVSASSPRWRVTVAAPESALVRLADGGGVLDSVRAGAGGVRWETPLLDGAADVRVGAQPLHVSAGDVLLSRSILVLGHAGWEGKFLIAALEESGWTVRARLAVAPGIDVRQGPTAPLDTARDAAVIVLDSSSARDAADIRRFVAEGGGAILAGTAPRGALAALALGLIGPRVPAASIAFVASAPRRALGFYPVLSPRADAVPLEWRDGHLAIAARRAGAGRVVQVGYDESWRWRMSGGDAGVGAHRSWWSGLVAGVAYRATQPRAGQTASGGAPYATTVAALGPPRPASPPDVPTGSVPRALTPLLFGLMCIALLGEWASRRLRGAR